jgi:hypothetical protein
MATLRIKSWHRDKAWASDGFTHDILFKRLQKISDIGGVALRRLGRQILRRDIVDVPLRSEANTETFISYLTAFGAEVAIDLSDSKS